MATENGKKANLLNHVSVGHLIDESVFEVVMSRGYIPDVSLNTFKLVMGYIIIFIALVAQFYKNKFPENRDFLAACVILYIVFIGILLLIVYTKEKNTIFCTHPPAGSLSSTGLVVCSRFPRFSHLYTLTISSSEPKSICANESVQHTKSVTRWFTKDGVLVEGFFWKDVEALIDDYSRGPKKSS
ncbi:probable signal peptidase complex subunit 2 [Cucurbita pepo subsp. pepo]|uniref:probable signal peptidase complex subunit 2 n=1 Tax=Cucurbita pepo subsp. pepo TaxID=3664 RepID=UPI000C9D6C78|nr:probable signal peptidase complex subunit 2 [Cucurbita pepo subsp. pepo]